MRHGPDALLCEGCGYHLRGLTRADVCPECGRPILESLHSRRQGTPWQQRKSVGSWWRTAWLTVRHPRTFWDHVRLGEHDSTPAIANLLFSAGVIGISLAVIHTAAGVWGWRFIWLLTLLVISYSAVAILGITTCAWIEMAGCRIIGRVHKWRLLRGSILATVEHAVIGWAAMGIAVLVLLCVSALAGRLGFESVRDVAGYQSGYWLIASILAGLVSFETLVYLGLRRLKYANPPGSEAELAQSGISPDGADPAPDSAG